MSRKSERSDGGRARAARKREMARGEMKIKGLARRDTSVKRNPTDYEGIGFLGINLGARATDTHTCTSTRDELFFRTEDIQDVSRERTS